MAKPKHITKNVVTSSVGEFQRLELKYVVPNNIVDVFVPHLENYMQYDPFSKEGFYDIFSVYFDTHDWQAFDAKMAGLPRRQKFRIRTYYPEPKLTEPVFLEVKEKRGQNVFKRRTPLPFEDVKKMLEGVALDTQNPVYNEWRHALIRNSLKPKLMNRYARLAFISEHYPGLRVTIDRDIQYAMTHEVRFDLPTRNMRWSQEKSVLELKFDRYVPQFMVDLIRQYNLTYEPVSKYCDSVISNYLLI